MESLQINHIGGLPVKPPGRTLLLATEADYCQAVADLRKDLAAAYDTIWIRQEHHFAWLRALIEHASLGNLRPIEFSKTTPRDILAASWALPVPDWLTDEMILAEQLLDRDAPTDHDSFAAALLSPIIGSISLISPKFPQTQAGLLAEKASAPATRVALASSVVVTAAWKSTVDTWTVSNPQSWISQFCSRLLDNPEKLWRDLTAWRLLHKYPQAQLEFALDPSAVAFVRNIPIGGLKGMSLNPQGLTLAIDQIQPFFEQASVGSISRSKFDVLLNAVSGELKEEFVGIEALLDGVKVTQADIDTISRRFQSCSELTSSQFAHLQLYIRPPQPVEIDAATATAEIWGKWFHTEYLPYRWWQIQRVQADPAVEEKVKEFSAWYCREFLHVHADPALSAVQALGHWRSSILKDDISLILLVDNLPWFFWDAFESALADAGLFKHESQDRFVPLPSHTSACKPALVSGQWDASGCDYLKMLESRSQNEWGGRPVRYLSGVDQLNALKTISSPTLLLLNYLASDEALHSDAAATGTTHIEQLSLFYKSLNKAVAAFARRASQGDKTFGLYVITDHGATFILPAEKESIDSQLAKRLFPNEKNRSASLSQAEAAQVPENLWALGHRFVNPSRNDGSVHFIPSGHNTVASPGQKLIYSHGGATPEEVITPCGLFRLYRADWAEPNVRFLNLKQKDGRAAFYIKRMTTVEIEVQNTNADECRLESVSITPNVGDIRDFHRVLIGTKSTAKTTVSLYFAVNATAVQTLTFEFTFRIAQETLIRHLEQPVSITSAATSGTDLTSLLS